MEPGFAVCHDPRRQHDRPAAHDVILDERRILGSSNFDAASLELCLPRERGPWRRSRVSSRSVAHDEAERETRGEAVCALGSIEAPHRGPVEKSGSATFVGTQQRRALERCAVLGRTHRRGGLISEESRAVVDRHELAVDESQVGFAGFGGRSLGNLRDLGHERRGLRRLARWLFG